MHSFVPITSEIESTEITPFPKTPLRTIADDSNKIAIDERSTRLVMNHVYACLSDLESPLPPPPVFTLKRTFAF